jgi:hypothetical protein
LRVSIVLQKEAQMTSLDKRIKSVTGETAHNTGPPNRPKHYPQTGYARNFLRPFFSKFGEKGK